MMVKLRAAKRVRFDGKWHEEGDEFETTNTYARVLEARGSATRSKTVEKIETPARGRSRYARRDMAAEEQSAVHSSPLHSAMTTASVLTPETSDEDKTS